MLDSDNRQEVLSCVTQVLSRTAKIYIPEESILKTEGQIHDDFSINPEAVIPLTYHIAVTPEQCNSKISFWDGLSNHIISQLPNEVKTSFDDKLTIDLSVLQHLPAFEKEPVFYATVGQIHDHWHVIDLDACSEERPLYAVAVDIGNNNCGCNSCGYNNRRDSRPCIIIQPADGIGR